MTTSAKSLTVDQRRLVRDSFEAVHTLAGPVGLLFYGRLFELATEVRPMFHNDLDLQIRKLMDMLSSVVESLDNFESIRPKLEDLGRLHAGYGVRPEQYEVLTAIQCERPASRRELLHGRWRKHESRILCLPALVRA